MKKVLLVGPKFLAKNSYYGGGTGGYTRNFKLYLEEFQFQTICTIPFFHSVRKKNQWRLHLITRLLRDVIVFVIALVKHRPIIVHVLAQYRSALPREAIWFLISLIMRIKFIYEIKAGQFDEMNASDPLHRLLTHFVIKHAACVLCEGNRTLLSVMNLNKHSIYFPNVVKETEVPAERRIFLASEPTKVLFVGYAYEGKGVFELVRALNNSHLYCVELNLIGEESTSFKGFLDKTKIRNGLTINRYGKRGHDFVLREMARNDIYCYPSKHKGEGHSNTINEAMMNELIIISSKVGFLADIVGENGFLIDEVSEKELTRVFADVFVNKALAIQKARNARLRVMSQFTSTKAKETLEHIYQNLTLK